MKILLPLITLSLVTLSPLIMAAQTPQEPGVLDLGDERVRLLSGTLSADGRYVGACAIRADKDKPPVDWDGIAKGEIGVYEYSNEEGYQISNVIVDLEQRAILIRLDFSEAYFPGRSSGGFSLTYGPEKDGRRLILAGNAGKWEPRGILLVEISASGVKQIDLLNVLNPAANKYLAKVRGNAKSYVPDYWLQDLPETGLLSGFADATTLRIPCIAQVPKEDDPVVYATVELRLSPGPDAEVVSVQAAKTATPEPVEDNPRVAAADKELNAAYNNLRGKLDAAGKADLLKEQREWLKNRDSKIKESLDVGSYELANARFATDLSLLQETRERTAVLLERAQHLNKSR